MTKLASASGIVIHEDGLKLYISKIPARWTSTFLFITGLLAVILLINGILQLFVFRNTENSSGIGIILLGTGIFFTILFWRVRIFQKKKNATPFHELEKIAVIDLGNNNLLDGQQHILTPLNRTYLRRKMQISSSSPELILEWENGSLSLVHGNPFSGGVAAIEKVLQSKGIRKK